MLRIETVSKTFVRKDARVVALHPTTLHIPSGQYVAIVGRSGSGKTTLLSILGGMLTPTAGKVRFENDSLYDLSLSARTALRRRKIGFVFQTFNLVPYLTALENVQVPLYLANLRPREQRRRAADLLDRVGLADRMQHKPGELSVGQQQRVALARTLANDPALILADEPTGNLDPETREQVLAMFDDIHHEGRTLMLVTHDHAAAARAERILSLVDGRLADDSSRIACVA